MGVRTARRVLLASRLPMPAVEDTQIDLRDILEASPSPMPAVESTVSDEPTTLDEALLWWKEANDAQQLARQEAQDASPGWWLDRNRIAELETVQMMERDFKAPRDSAVAEELAGLRAKMAEHSRLTAERNLRMNELDKERRRRLDVCDRLRAEENRGVREEALRLRDSFRGQTVRIKPEWQNPNNWENPFALDPSFFFGSHFRHPETKKYAWARVLDNGLILKARTRNGIEQLERSYNAIAPMMKDLDLEVPVLYEIKGYSLGGQCCGASNWSKELPKVIQLNTEAMPDNQLWSLIHETAHLRVMDHSEQFRRNFADHLDHYIRNYATPEQAAFLEKNASTDTYAPPIWNEHRNQSGFRPVLREQDWNGRIRHYLHYEEMPAVELGDLLR
jgi:hypothetical protein